MKNLNTNVFKFFYLLIILIFIVKLVYNMLNYTIFYVVFFPLIFIPLHLFKIYPTFFARSLLEVYADLLIDIKTSKKHFNQMVPNIIIRNLLNKSIFLIGILYIYLYYILSTSEFQELIYNENNITLLSSSIQTLLLLSIFFFNCYCVISLYIYFFKNIPTKLQLIQTCGICVSGAVITSCGLDIISTYGDPNFVTETYQIYAGRGFGFHNPTDRQQWTIISLSSYEGNVHKDFLLDPNSNYADSAQIRKVFLEHKGILSKFIIK